MEIQLDRIRQRAPDPFWTRQSNRCGRGGTLTPNNVKWSPPLRIPSKGQQTSIKGRMGRCGVTIPVLRRPTKATEGLDCTPRKPQHPSGTSKGESTDTKRGLV